MRYFFDDEVFKCNMMCRRRDREIQIKKLFIARQYVSSMLKQSSPISSMQSIINQTLAILRREDETVCKNNTLAVMMMMMTVVVVKGQTYVQSKTVAYRGLENFAFVLIAKGSNLNFAFLFSLRRAPTSIKNITVVQTRYCRTPAQSPIIQ
eukprot:scaffold27655_cov69-Cyclotella_meneghiniana.AAC.2